MKPHLYYDLATCPNTFDFLHFVAFYKLICNREGFKGFDISIIDCDHRLLTPREKGTSQELKSWRVTNVLFTLANCIDGVRSVSIIRSRDFNVAPFALPLNYSPTSPPRSEYNPSALNALLTKDSCTHLHFLSPSKGSIDLWSKLIATAGISKGEYILLMPRMSQWDKDRNLHLGEWEQAASDVERAGVEVIILPDFDQVFTSNLKCAIDVEFAPVAMSLDLRLAAMSLARHTIIGAGGLWGLGLYSPFPFTVVNFYHPNHPIANERYYKGIGLEIGGKYPWMLDSQSICWDAGLGATVERIL